MFVAWPAPKCADYFTDTGQSEDHMSPPGAWLCNLDPSGEQQNYLFNAIPNRENGLRPRKVFFMRGRNDRAAVGGRDVRKQSQSLNENDILAWCTRAAQFAFSLS